jgi:hypothetical protein
LASLKVTADGFPAGHDTPEGVACDLARAFIKRDAALFTNSCIRPFGGGVNRTNYHAFLESTVESIKQESAKKEPSQCGPKTITKVFAARHLSHDGPSSYGYAMFNFQDVMFVDVAATLYDGQQSTNRTMVIKKGDGKWFVYPTPENDTLLSTGLNDESDSKQDISEAYKIEK